jgi:hypothetical protein
MEVYVAILIILGIFALRFGLPAVVMFIIGRLLAEKTDPQLSI